MTSTAIDPAVRAPSAEAAAPPGLLAAGCPSCGAAMPSPYCAQCGERRVLPGDAALGRFFREAFEEVASVDSRTMRSLRALAFRPGELTTEYLNGRRRLYLGPLRLYLGVFAVTMLLMAFVPDAPQRSSGSGILALDAVLGKLFAAIAAARSVTPAQARELLGDTVRAHVHWVSLVLPLIFGGLVHALFFRRRRWFSENLVFATHFAALNYLVGITLMPVQLALAERGPGVVSVAVLAMMLTYLFLAMRRVYGLGRRGAVASSIVLFLGFAVAQLVMSVLAVCTASIALLYF